MSGTDLARIGCALLCGAALALPIGFVLGRLDFAGSPDPGAGPRDATMRDVFSPSVRRDPYFLERQRAGIEALERHCETTGDGCAVARAARLRLNQLEAGK